jgi:hypothetical protein
MSVVTQLYFHIVEYSCVRLLNTVALRWTFIHLISTSIESHNGDDATKDKHWQFEGENSSANNGCRLHIYLLTNKTLINASVYVFENWGKNVSHKKCSTVTVQPSSLE